MNEEAMNDEHAPENVSRTAGGMSPEASDRELLEARITAHALGQLEAAEAAEIDLLLADPSGDDARRQFAEVRLLAEAIKAAPEEPGPERSADLRRAVVAAAAAATPSVAPAAAVVTPASGRLWWPRAAAVGSLAAMLLVAVTLWVGRPADRMVAMREQRPRDEAVAATEQSARMAEEEAIDARPEAAVEPRKAEKLQTADREVKQKTLAKTAPTAATPAAEPAAAPPTTRVPLRDDESRLRLAAPARKAGVASGAGGAATEALANATVKPTFQMADQRAAGSFASDLDAAARQASGEGYAAIAESRAAVPREQPLSTFSVDVDTASYANVRRFLAAGRLPPRDAVRIEELVNYFRYDYPQPDGDEPFSITVDAAECPWRPGHRLVRIGLQGRNVDRRERPAGNLVFLVDVSGSMQAANKLPLVKQALAMLLEELTENDRVAIVTYAGNAGLALPPTTGDRKQVIRAAIEALEAGGSTHGSAGIALAYEQAREHFIPGGSNRVILATDGDLNVGVTSTAALVDLIKEKAKGGVFLTVLGFGEGNLQDGKMEALADNGNGIYAYIDGVREARKVLVEQLTGSTVTIAKDVKIQVEFNPAQVASYRLLGYENRALAARDFRDDRKDAGEIGAGHSVTALYEIALVGEEGDGPGVEPLKYQPRREQEAAAGGPAAADRPASRELLTVKLRWKRPDAEESTGLEVPLADRGPDFQRASADLRFAAAVAAFGMILRGSDQRGGATLPLVARIAGDALGRDDGGYRAEFLDLVRRAESAR